MEAFRVAIVGGGGVSAAHVAAAKSSGGSIKVVAGVDPAEPARRALAGATGAAAYASFDELLADAKMKLDGVIICTPPSVRIPIIRAALARKIPLLVEKPLAHTLADAREMSAMAKASPVPSAVGFCHRFVPAVKEMKRALLAGEIGSIIRFENTFAGFNPGMQRRWMSEISVSGGGSFIDTGSHSLDLFRYLVGDADVVGAVYSKQWPGRGESGATVLLRGESAAGVIQSGWLEPGRFKLSLVGTTGRLIYDYDRPTELIRIGPDDVKMVQAVASHEGRFESQLQAFAGFARGGARGELADFVDGAKVAQLVDAAGKASII